MIFRAAQYWGEVLVEKGAIIVGIVPKKVKEQVPTYSVDSLPYRVLTTVEVDPTDHMGPEDLHAA